MENLKLSQLIFIASDGFKQLFGEFDFCFESEISRLKIVNSNVYLDLVECGKSGEIIAKARGCIFDLSIWNRFMYDLNIKNIEEIKGCKLLFNGKLSFHYEYGFSIHISAVSSEYVIGQLKKNQDDIRTNLIQLGIFDKNKKVSLPFPPYKVAVISSVSSEGLKDFTTVLNDSGFLFDIELYESAIHGNDAKTEVYRNLQTIYTEIKGGKKIDFVAIIRGGGGSHGITWQNDINIAKGVAYMQVPVIVAVGHTNDKYILDDISRFSAKTPTQAAYILLDIVNTYCQSCDEIYRKINDFALNKFQYFNLNIDFIHQQIQNKMLYKLENIKADIEKFYHSIFAFSPENLVKYGYAVLSNKQGSYLKKNDIDILREGDHVYMKVYDKKFLIEIKEIL